MTLQLRLHHVAFILALLSLLSAGLFALLLRVREGRTMPPPSAGAPSPSKGAGGAVAGDVRRAVEARLRNHAAGERAAREGRVILGMDPDQVRRAWGPPAEVRPRLQEGRRAEVWIYRRGGSLWRVTLDRGAVTQVRRLPAP